GYGGRARSCGDYGTATTPAPPPSGRVDPHLQRTPAPAFGGHRAYFQHQVERLLPTRCSVVPGQLVLGPPSPDRRHHRRVRNQVLRRLAGDDPVLEADLLQVVGRTARPLQLDVQEPELVAGRTATEAAGQRHLFQFRRRQ